MRRERQRKVDEKKYASVVEEKTRKSLVKRAKSDSPKTGRASVVDIREIGSTDGDQQGALSQRTNKFTERDKKMFTVRKYVVTERVLGNKFQKIRVYSPELNNMNMGSNHKEQILRDLDST